MSVKIYHNPRCSKSRQALLLLQNQGITPVIIEYLKNPPTLAEVHEILDRLKLTPRELMRKQEAEYKTLALDNPNLSDDELCNALVAHPKLIERPIVMTSQGAVIGRPPEAVLTIL